MPFLNLPELLRPVAPQPPPVPPKSRLEELLALMAMQQDKEAAGPVPGAVYSSAVPSDTTSPFEKALSGGLQGLMSIAAQGGPQDTAMNLFTSGFLPRVRERLRTGEWPQVEPYMPSIETDPLGALIMAFPGGGGVAPSMQQVGAAANVARYGGAAGQGFVKGVVSGIEQPYNRNIFSNEAELQAAQQAEKQLGYVPGANVGSRVGQALRDQRGEARINPLGGEEPPPIEMPTTKAPIQPNLIKAVDIQPGESVHDALVRAGPPPEGYTQVVPPGNVALYFIKKGLSKPIQEAEFKAAGLSTPRQAEKPSANVPQSPSAVEAITSNVAPTQEPGPIVSRLETGEGRVAAGFDPRLLKTLGGNLYNGDLGQIAAKELLQNATDSALHLGENAKVDLNYKPADRSIDITDNGTGMSPEVLKHEYADVGASLKQAGSAGGLGLAKVAYLANAENIYVTTVADVGGKKIKSILTGSGDDWVDQSKGLSLSSVEVPSDTPTGTRVEIQLKEGVKTEPYYVTQFLKQFIDTHRLPHNISITKDGQPIENTVYDPEAGVYKSQPRTAPTLQKLDTLNVPGASIDIFASKDTVKSSYTRVSVLNNGLPQFEVSVYLPEAVDIPKHITADVKALGLPDEPNYPFQPSREALHTDVETAVADYVRKTLVGKALQSEKMQLSAAFNNSPKIPGAGNLMVLDDSGGKLPREFIDGLSNRPYIQALVKVVDGVVQELYRDIASMIPQDLPMPKFGGIGLSKTYRGVNIRTSAFLESSSPNMIFINPFTMLEHVGRLKLGLATLKLPEALADEITSVVVHEIGHQLERGHGEGMTTTLTDFYAVTLRKLPAYSEMVEDVLKVQKAEEIERDFNTYNRIATDNNVFNKAISGAGAPSQGGGGVSAQSGGSRGVGQHPTVGPSQAIVSQARSGGAGGPKSGGLLAGTPPGPPPAPSGATTPPAPTFYDPLNIRDVGDVLADADLRDVGAAGKARELIGKVLGEDLHRINPTTKPLHPGFGNAADDMAALSEEHHRISSRASSYVSVVYDSVKAAARLDIAIGKTYAHRQVIDAGKVAQSYVKTYATGKRAGRWIQNRLRDYAGAVATVTDPEALATLASSTVKELLQETTNRWYKAQVGDVVRSKLVKKSKEDIAITKRQEFEISGQFFNFPFVTGYNNLARSFDTKYDASISGIQLWALGHRYPKEFLQTFGAMIGAIKDPDAMAKIISENEDVIRHMIRHGVIWSGEDPLAQEGVAQVGVKIPRPGTGTVKGRLGKAAIDVGVLPGRAMQEAGGGSDRVFQVGGNLMRLLVWKKWMKRFHNASEEQWMALGQFMDSMTGLSPHETTGLEQFTAFASKFLRTPLESLGTAAFGKPGPARDMAREIMAMFFGVEVVLILLANWARGKDTDFDPDSPNFFRIRDVNGQDVTGLAGYHPYLVLFAQAAKNGPWKAGEYAVKHGLDPEIAKILFSGIGEAGFNFMGGRNSPSASVLRNLIEQSTFKRGKFESPSDTGKWAEFLALMVVEHFTPFAPDTAISSIVNEIRRGGSTPQAVINAVTGVFFGEIGIKASGLSRTDYYDKIVLAGDYTRPDGSKAKRYGELGPADQAEVQRKFKETGDARIFLTSAPVTTNQKVSDTEKELYEEQLVRDEKLKKFFAGDKDAEIGPKEWLEARDSRWKGVATLQKVLDRDPAYQHHIEMLKKQSGDGDFARFWAALEGYYKLGEDYKKPYGLGIEDEYFDARDSYIANLPEDERKFVTKNIHVNSTAMEKEYMDDLVIMAPYLGAADTVAKKNNLEAINKRLNEMPKGPEKDKILSTDKAAITLVALTKAEKERLKATNEPLRKLLEKWQIIKPAPEPIRIR